MNFAVMVVLAIASTVAAMPQQSFPAAFSNKFGTVAGPIIPVLSRTEVRDEAGQFSLSYQSADGTSLSEQGVLKSNNKGDGHVLVKQGSYSYNSPEGTPITLSYVADENGFQPSGAHLPISVQPIAPTF